MSFHTQSRKLHVLGRLWRSPSEIKSRVPWYASLAWLKKKETIKNRVARRVELAHARSVARKEYAKEKGLLPYQVTNAMIGFVKVSNWVSKRSQKIK